MAIPYVFRRPRLPVIVVADDRAFRATSTTAIQKLLRRELRTAATVRLLDSQWEWFEVLTGEVEAIAPSFVDFQPPTKQSVITLVNGRANRSETSAVYQPRSLSSRSREEIFQELLAILPVDRQNQETAQMITIEYPAAVVCVENEGNEVSLQLWKIYKPLRDNDARSEGFLRVVDESGEDYLFPEENFVPIELPNEVKRPFERSVREQRRAATTPRTSGSVKRAASVTAKKSKRSIAAGRPASR